MNRGLILFAHGSRDARWAAPFEAVAHSLRTMRPQLQLQLAYLEQMSPGLAEAAAALAATGCERVDVLPMFLGTGGHLRRDLPPMIEQLRTRHPSVQWRLHAAVGEQPAMHQAMAATALALLDDSGATRGPEV